MIEMYEEVYIGSDADVDEFLEMHPDGCIIHAAKEPWHRNALGYTGRAAPKTHPHYYYKTTDTRMYLNLVDSPNVEYIPREVIDPAVIQAVAWYREGKPILIHCNKGESRSRLLGFCLRPILGQLKNHPGPPLGEGCYEYGLQNFERYEEMS